MGTNAIWNHDLSDGRAGERDLITDVPGVRVGHVTLRSPDGAAPAIRTGVTAVVPPGDCFASKLPAAAYVSNGFGKSMGLVQVEELGSLETPILMTNTLSCGACFDALVDHALDDHPAIGVDTGTVNPVVMECNDGPINSIRARAVTPAHGLEAIAAAGEDFDEGDVGAGTGMTCFGLKGGIGSASRVVRVDGRDHVIGVLTLTNFGSRECLRLDGEPVGRRLAEAERRHRALRRLYRQRQRRDRRRVQHCQPHRPLGRRRPDQTVRASHTRRRAAHRDRDTAQRERDGPVLPCRGRRQRGGHRQFAAPRARRARPRRQGHPLAARRAA